MRLKESASIYLITKATIHMMAMLANAGEEGHEH